MRNYLLSLWFCTIMLLAAAQQMPVGAFRTHLSGTTFHSVAVSPTHVYAAGASHIVCYNKKSQAITPYSKAEGLSDVLISQIYYDQATDYLVVAYDNANLDFIKDGKIYNMSDIKNKTIIGEKRIKDFFSYGGTLYLVCSFGVVTIDMSRLIITDTWYTRRASETYAARALTCYNDRFYLATDRGVFHTPITNAMMADFGSWQSDNTTLDFDMFCSFRNHLYAGRIGDSTIYYKSDAGWQQDSRFRWQDLRDIEAIDTALLVCGWGYVEVYDTNAQILFYHYWDTPNAWADARQVGYDEQHIWVADHNNGLVKIYKSYWSNILITANGPWRDDAFRMDLAGDRLVMVPGGFTSVWASNYTQPYFNMLKDGEWTTLHSGNTPALQGVYDFTDAAVNPRNVDECYVGSFHSGLFRFVNGTLAQVYTHDNSPLNALDTCDAYIAGVTFDAANNLWISMTNAAVPLMVLKNDGTWQRISLGSLVPAYTTAVDRVLIDSRGWKWVPCPRIGKLIVYDDNNTISTLSDDRTTNVNMNAISNIETHRINCLAEDKNGRIWIGCDIGVKVIYNPANIFKGSAFPENILIEQMDHVQNLFEFDEITAIAVDGGNRKWVGTVKSGVFLISPDGEEELLHFTADNSPLLSNKISDICIQPNTGEVFIATSNGLISYQGTATEGRPNYDNVIIYPNPVRESYHGVVTVSGLMEQSFCKITDSAGTLVWQGYAMGGTLTWDGKDFYGKRPATGVYFVFASDKSGKEKKVGKLLFIK